MPLDRLTNEVSQLNNNIDRVIKSQRIRTQIFAAFGVLLVLSFFVGFAIAGIAIRANTESLDKRLTADCQLAKDVAEAPVAPGTGALGRKIVKDFRDSYNAKCIEKYGQLKPADPDLTEPRIRPSPSRSVG